VDVGAKAEIQNIIAKRVEEGCAVLLISSEFEELIEGAHNIVVLRRAARCGACPTRASPRRR
jgi:ribose transport system ATP-binding protein